MTSSLRPRMWYVRYNRAVPVVKLICGCGRRDPGQRKSETTDREKLCLYVHNQSRHIGRLIVVYSGYINRYTTAISDYSSCLREGLHPSVPSKEMYLYASMASLGDDVYHEPSTLALEAHMAKMSGKDAALFLPSGTMSNQIALRTHLKQPPYAVLCDHRAHILK